jgi:chorismate dehydratase
MKKLKLGRVSYRNTVPLFYGWNLPFVKVVEGTPSELAKKVELGILDGGILSSLFYITHRERFALMPDVSISSFGAVGSVLLLSEKPLEEIKTVKPSAESLTSNFLTYVLFKKFLKRDEVEFLKAEKADAELVIGDGALRLRETFKGFIYDIGELWFEFTKLPAVFAVFVVPKRWVFRNPKEAAELALALMESKEKFFNSEGFESLDENTKSYLKGLNYDLREEHIRSLELLERLYKEFHLGEF